MELRPSIDYTNKDFASLRQAMLDLARYRLPEWTDRSPGDLGMLLIDLFAYMGDIMLYYQDRIANESFLATATERRSVMHQLRLIGYEMQPPGAAAADLTLTFKKPAANAATTIVTIREGAQFSTDPSTGSVQFFTYQGPDLQIDLASAQVESNRKGKLLYKGLPVRHSRSVPTEPIGSSTGEPNQAFRLSQSPLIVESLRVEVNEGAGWIEWKRRESLLYYVGPDGRITLSSPRSRDYFVQFDENDVASVIFGDGVYGLIPPPGTNNIQATYSAGGGAAGNAPAGTINHLHPMTKIDLLDSVTNPTAAAGGTDHESKEHAIRFGPQAFRSGQRAVTLSDFVTLAYQIDGIAKVRARNREWNQIELFIAPQGTTCSPVPEDLRRRIIAYFEDRRMIGTVVKVLDPLCVAIDVSMELIVNHHYQPRQVQQAVTNAVNDQLAFDNVDFGQPLYLSDFYNVVENTPGVYAVTITRFRRRDSPAVDFERQLQSLNLPPLAQLPDFLQRALNVDAGGRIDIGDYELPYLGDLVVTIKGVTP